VHCVLCLVPSASACSLAARHAVLDRAVEALLCDVAAQGASDKRDRILASAECRLAGLKRKASAQHMRQEGCI
jgi:hypothetical protein